MMTPQERAKIFMPFDALKGLQEALRDREERYSREEKREISEERVEQISRVLQKLKPGMKVEIRYYCAFHEVKKIGIVSGIDPKGNPIVISGNHGHRVAEATYSRGRVYAYVMPSS